MMKPRKYFILRILTVSSLLFAANLIMAGSAYDPLVIPAQFTPEIIDLTVNDAERKRDIPVRVYLPVEKTPSPVVLFSHGLGGSREGNAYLGNHWAARGYVAVFIQHHGSDTSVWQDKPKGGGWRRCGRRQVWKTLCCG